MLFFIQIRHFLGEKKNNTFFEGDFLQKRHMAPKIVQQAVPICSFLLPRWKGRLRPLAEFGSRPAVGHASHGVQILSVELVLPPNPWLKCSCLFPARQSQHCLQLLCLCQEYWETVRGKPSEFLYFCNSLTPHCSLMLSLFLPVWGCPYFLLPRWFP